MTDKELDDLFQNKLSGHEMPVPKGMWDRVNPQEDKRRRGAFLWWSILGIAAFFIITGTAVWLYHAPSQSARTDEATQTKTQDSQSSQEHNATLPQQQATTTNGAAASGAGNGSSSSQITSVNNNNSHQKDFYTNHRNWQTGTTAASTQQNTSADYTHNNIAGSQSNTQLNSKHNNQNNTAADNYSNNHNNSSPVAPVQEQAVNSPAVQFIASEQKPDSSHTTSVNSPTVQTANATNIKVKKIHGEKVPSLELMVAGYGDSRNVYDITSQMRTGGVVAFGPINTKEEVLMHSFSINARINKPLTKNISVLTGLQYMQTRQRTSYSFQSVDQSMVINSLTTDTTVFARFQSKQSEVKGTYNGLSVPLLISYHTSAKKVSLGATAGVMVNVLSWYSGEITGAGNSGAVHAKNTFRAHTGTSLYAGITASKQVGGFQLFAEPHVQYTLSSITKTSASFRQKITGYGFGIGIRKTIGK